MVTLQRKKPRRRNAVGAYPASWVARRQASVAGPLLAEPGAVGAELERLVLRGRLRLRGGGLFRGGAFFLLHDGGLLGGLLRLFGGDLFVFATASESFL